MALTGRKKHLVRQMLNSDNKATVNTAKVMLKSAGYSEREIQQWIDFNKQSSTHKEKVAQRKVAKEMYGWIGERANKIVELPTGIDGMKRFDELIKEAMKEFDYEQ